MLRCRRCTCLRIYRKQLARQTHWLSDLEWPAVPHPQCPASSTFDFGSDWPRSWTGLQSELERGGFMNTIWLVCTTLYWQLLRTVTNKYDTLKHLHWRSLDNELQGWTQMFTHCRSYFQAYSLENKQNTKSVMFYNMVVIVTVFVNAISWKDTNERNNMQKQKKAPSLPLVCLSQVSQCWSLHDEAINNHAWYHSTIKVNEYTNHALIFTMMSLIGKMQNNFIVICLVQW